MSKLKEDSRFTTAVKGIDWERGRIIADINTEALRMRGAAERIRFLRGKLAELDQLIAICNEYSPDESFAANVIWTDQTGSV